jgi:hypothetical protein
MLWQGKATLISAIASVAFFGYFRGIARPRSNKMVISFLLALVAAVCALAAGIWWVVKL